MELEYKDGLVLITQRIEKLFGNPNDYNLHELPVETLEAMKSWLSVQLTFFYSVKSERFDNWNSAKAALKTALTEKKVAYLKDLTGSEKARIATMYAENDLKTEIHGVAVLENEYNEIKDRIHASETIRMSLMQTISTANKEVERQQFIKNA